MTTGRYTKGSLMGILVSSSVAGIGLSFGRDIYNTGKRSFIPLALATIALAGTAYGAWNMSRGHDRGPVGTFFLTFLANVLIICVSAAVFCLAAFLVGSSEKIGATEADLLIFMVSAQLAFILVGVLIGFAQRAKRKQAFAVANANELFLINAGFRDVGGREQVMIDAQGNELVLDDARSDAILFKVKGRRGARARITLDTDGRMIGYTLA